MTKKIYVGKEYWDSYGGIFSSDDVCVDKAFISEERAKKYIQKLFENNDSGMFHKGVIEELDVDFDEEE